MHIIQLFIQHIAGCVLEYAWFIMPNCEICSQGLASVLEHSSKRTSSNKSIKFMTKDSNINPNSTTEVSDAVLINFYGL